ncbi:MAG: GGDEF domain-containing protein [SAR324 cluster bacterium]|nr:GGDEF domain-containing protein [SAR324 cluster bacterium]
MSENSANSINPGEILNRMDYGVNVVDSQFNVLFMNLASRKKWNIIDFNPATYKCHKLLFGNDTPCSNCPLRQMEQTGDPSGQIVGALNTPDYPNHRVKYHRMGHQRFVQTLTDITKETELVRQVTIQSKETQAQNIILKRQRQQFEDNSAFLASVFNAIRSGFLILDSPTTLNATSTNKAFIDFFQPASEKEVLSKKCYQLFGFQRRCPACPIEHINDRTDFSSMRYHQNVADYTLTEFYSVLPDGKILLTFEDSTKRVQLVQQVKEDKEIIERQNQIFRALLETGTDIQTTKELDELFTVTLNQLQNLFFNINFGIILNGERANIIESAVFQGFSVEEQLTMVEYNLQLLEPGISEIVIEQVKERYKAQPGNQVHSEMNHISILPVKGRDRKNIGKLLVKGPELDKHSLEIITIFLEQLAAVAENKLLTKQLEKMANTDPLTGAYNRGFFGRELDSAIQNAKRFSIAFSILLLDVNGLKRVNDVFGHEAGDEMIITVAALLREVCRRTDIVTRLGGDEFVVLCPSTDFAQAQRLLERIREREERTTMVCTHSDGTKETIPVHMSIGTACSESVVPEEVLKEADTLMYADKEAYYANKAKYR